MVPQIQFVESSNEIKTNENKTYRLDPLNKRLRGFTNGVEALHQAVQKILTTERQTYLIYGVDYGIEAERLIGKDIDFVKADIERTIKDSLSQDDRILEITDFVYDISGDALLVSFFISSIYGQLKIENEVNI